MVHKLIDIKQKEGHMHIYTDLAAELRELSSDESGIEEETVQKVVLIQKKLDKK